MAALSAAATAKPVKLNTLEKSKLDWETFKSKSTQQAAAAVFASAHSDPLAPVLTDLQRAEMEAQTKGGAVGLGNMGGYLERRDFLERVESRRQRMYDDRSKA